MHLSKNRKLSLASVFFTFFVDNLCWSIVFPIFAPYFLDPTNRLFSADVSEATRTALLGFFLMAFSLGQFLGAPILGEYADRHGRKKAFVLSILFTLGGLALSAWAMGTNNLPLLFIGRLVTGIFASNMAICLACVSDLSHDEKSKVKNFGYLSVLAGLSFILGAFLGGKLSDPTVDPDFSPSVPLWLASGMTLFNLLFIIFAFRETTHVDPSVKFKLFESFRNLKMALKTEKIKRIYLIYFLFLFAWTILFQFTPVLVVQRFSFTGSDIGDLALYMGLCWAIGSGYLNKLLLRYFFPLRILELCLLAFTVLCGAIVLTHHLQTTLGILGASVMIGGLAWPLCTGVISNLAPKEIQGKILGMSQSVQSLAMTVAPLAGGFAYRFSLDLVFFVGAGASLIAGIVYFSLKER